jgi:hypothetical protein
MKVRRKPNRSTILCPFCRSLISGKDSLVQCSECKTLHHTGCWQAARHCSSFGCSGEPNSIEAKVLRRRRLLLLMELFPLVVSPVFLLLGLATCWAILAFLYGSPQGPPVLILALVLLVLAFVAAYRRLMLIVSKCPACERSLMTGSVEDRDYLVCPYCGVLLACLPQSAPPQIPRADS